MSWESAPPHAIESLEHEFLRAVRFQRDRDEFLRTQSQEQPATTSGGPALEGPIPPNRFAFGGVEVVLQPKDWEAVNALYQRDHRTMGVDDFALAVWGDEEMRKAQFDGIRRRVNNAFLGADIPFQLAKTGRQISLDKLK